MDATPRAVVRNACAAGDDVGVLLTLRVAVSLGTVMYVMLCGFPPFMPPGKSSTKTIEEQVGCPP